MSAAAFAAAHPRLFHVTERSALPGIRAHGLLPATRLAALHGAPPALVAENRDGWAALAPGAVLRRQGMRDAPLRSRLDPAIGLEEWRAFINGMVFCFGQAAAARRFRLAEPARDQVVLAFETTAVLASGATLLTCRFNNGYLDRSPPGRRRLRHFSDYRPLGEWHLGQRVQEVAIPGGLPPGLAFAVLEAEPAA